jgi:hypothetical protein
MAASAVIAYQQRECSQTWPPLSVSKRIVRVLGLAAAEATAG